MAIALKIPEVGESITDVEIGQWLKAEGDRVERDEEIVVIETEKATVPISAPESGTIAKILKHSGESAKVGEVIGQIEEAKAEANGDASNSRVDHLKAQGRENTATPPKEIEAATEDLRTESVEPVEIIPDAKKEAAIDEESAKREKATRDAAEDAFSREVSRPKPVWRSKTDSAGSEAKEREENSRQAREHALKETQSKAKPIPLSARGPQPSAGAPAEEKQPEGAGLKIAPSQDARRDEKTIPMTALRRHIAERLVQAQQNAALLTTFNEIDMSAVIAMRDRYRDSFNNKYSAKLGFMSFFVKAAVEALKLIPEVNAEIRGKNIVYRNFFDIGVAIGGGKGLVVPVLRNAERLSFAEVERAIGDFARRAKENRLKPDELAGGTFTISNGGIYGSLLSTPIVNPPQSGILGMHAIQDRPVAHSGTVTIRPMMYVALTYDHRIVDGREAVTFLKHIKELVEDPIRILLEV